MANRLTPDQMVSVKAVAPFEIALVFKLWAEMMQVEAHRQGFKPDHVCNIDIDANGTCNGLGAPWPHRGERSSEFGERAAFAIFTLLKEI